MKSGSGILLIGVGIAAVWGLSLATTKSQGSKLKFQLKKLSLGNIKITSSVLDLGVRVQNPTSSNFNPGPFTFKGAVVYDGSEIAKIDHSANVGIGAGKFIDLPIQCKLSNLSIVSKLLKLFTGNQSNSYTVSGSINYQGLNIPVNYTGSILPTNG